MNTLKVEACEGKMVPLHASDVPHDANITGQFILKAGDPPIDVPDSTAIRRRIRSGDLREVKSSMSARVEAALAKPVDSRFDSLK
jgi:hypothetical protein